MRFYIWSLAVLLIVLTGNILGISEDLFIKIPAYDVFMHIAGGLGIGLAIRAAVVAHRGCTLGPVAAVITGVLLFGLVWEAFEIIFDLSRYDLWSASYYVDTVKDLADDTIGGVMALWFFPGKVHV